jgi:hypothetical protein
MEHRPSTDDTVHDHEHTDIPVRTIGKYMVGFVIAGIVIVLVLGGLWNWFGRTIPEEARVPAWQGPRELPPTPRLQIAPRADLEEYRRKEFNRLHTYGWVDQPAGKVHIPIDQAIEAVVRAGLPARPQTASAGDQRRDAATEASNNAVRAK